MKAVKITYPIVLIRLMTITNKAIAQVLSDKYNKR
jgi:hypothetical protein